MASKGDTWWTRTIGDDNAETILGYLRPQPDSNIPQTAVVLKQPAGILPPQLVTPLLIGIGLLIVFLVIRKMS